VIAYKGLGGHHGQEEEAAGNKKGCRKGGQTGRDAPKEALGSPGRSKAFNAVPEAKAPAETIHAGK
jgi:hypothetical protein